MRSGGKKKRGQPSAILLHVPATCLKQVAGFCCQGACTPPRPTHGKSSLNLPSTRPRHDQTRKPMPHGKTSLRLDHDSNRTTCFHLLSRRKIKTAIRLLKSREQKEMHNLSMFSGLFHPIASIILILFLLQKFCK